VCVCVCVCVCVYVCALARFSHLVQVTSLHCRPVEFILSACSGMLSVTPPTPKEDMIDNVSFKSVLVGMLATEQ
jgi:hypothetical protein